MTAGQKIIDGATEALAIVRGEKPAARMHINGHAYVPEEHVPDLTVTAKTTLRHWREECGKLHAKVRVKDDEIAKLTRDRNELLMVIENAARMAEQGVLSADGGQCANDIRSIVPIRFRAADEPKAAATDTADDPDYHKPDESGYSRADEEWFFDHDGKG